MSGGAKAPSVAGATLDCKRPHGEIARSSLLQQLKRHGAEVITHSAGGRTWAAGACCEMGRQLAWRVAQVPGLPLLLERRRPCVRGEPARRRLWVSTWSNNGERERGRRSAADPRKETHDKSTQSITHTPNASTARAPRGCPGEAGDHWGSRGCNRTATRLSQLAVDEVTYTLICIHLDPRRGHQAL